jgi:hypothetical protein
MACCLHNAILVCRHRLHDQTAAAVGFALLQHPTPLIAAAQIPIKLTASSGTSFACCTTMRLYCGLPAFIIRRVSPVYKAVRSRKPKQQSKYAISRAMCTTRSRTEYMPACRRIVITTLLRLSQEILSVTVFKALGLHIACRTSHTTCR